MAILNHLMSEVLPDVNVLRALSTTNDAVSPLNAHGVVLVHRSRESLGEAHAVEEPEVLLRYITSVAARAVVAE